MAEVRSRYAAAGEPLVGHFGSFGRDIADLVVRVLAASPEDAPRYNILLIGPRGEVVRDALITVRPDFVGRVHATGSMPLESVSSHIKACDVMLQPYSDGVTARRTSFMAGLVLGRPIVTTLGALSEPFWATSAAASFGDPANPAELAEALVRLLRDPAERQRLSATARSTYQQRFDISHTIDALHRS